MPTEISKAKIELRAKIRAALEKISPAVSVVESKNLCARLEVQMHSAGTILFFMPMPDEPDVRPLLEKFLAAGKICALPFFDLEKELYATRQVKNPAVDLVVGKFGIREPSSNCAEIALEKINMVLVPGMAFDLSGNRLGRGLGFYDRLLENVSGVKCGVGYDFQLLEKIPTEAHDAKVDFIVTPSRCMAAAR